MLHLVCRRRRRRRRHNWQPLHHSVSPERHIFLVLSRFNTNGLCGLRARSLLTPSSLRPLSTHHRHYAPKNLCCRHMCMLPLPLLRVIVRRAHFKGPFSAPSAISVASFILSTFSSGNRKSVCDNFGTLTCVRMKRLLDVAQCACCMAHSVCVYVYV